MPRETPIAHPASTASNHAEPSARSSEAGIFRKEGEYWTVGYGNKLFRLKDSKGFAYLAHLLRHPAVEFHALDLVGGMASHGEDDETHQSMRGLPGGDADLEPRLMQVIATAPSHCSMRIARSFRALTNPATLAPGTCC